MRKDVANLLMIQKRKRKKKEGRVKGENKLSQTCDLRWDESRVSIVSWKIHFLNGPYL